MIGRIHWRCFHCGDTFTLKQERWAREHFGRNEGETPVCLMRVPGESALLTVLRKAQDELAGYRAEDTNLHRALYAQSADHAQALIREEERGYAKGVADARAEPGQDLSPVVSPLVTDDRELLGEAWGALNFILAFYDPNQRHLDTEAWKNAEASGRRAHAKLRARLDAVASVGSDVEGK